MSKSWYCSKLSQIMPIHLKNYEIIKYDKIIDKSLFNFCIFTNCDSNLYEEATSDNNGLSNEWKSSINKEE